MVIEPCTAFLYNFLGVKTDLFIKNQEHNPVKDEITKSFDALQVIK